MHDYFDDLPTDTMDMNKVQDALPSTSQKIAQTHSARTLQGKLPNEKGSKQQFAQNVQGSGNTKGGNLGTSQFSKLVKGNVT